MSKHLPGRHSPDTTKRRTSYHAERVVSVKSSQKTKQLYKLISVLGCVVVILVLVVYILYFYNLNKTRQSYVELSESVRVKPVVTAEPVQTDLTEDAEDSEGLPLTTQAPVQIPINLPRLQYLNDDVDGWIEVPGTDIDYPVLYDTSDDAYYLSHSMTGEYATAGSIVVEDSNCRGFVDFNTVLYGHNMRDDTMFAQLHDFEDKSFFDTHETILVYTNDSVLTYIIFAAYTRDDAHILNSYSYDTVDERQAYIDEIYKHDGVYNYDIEVMEDDRIITLSTCTGWNSTRFLVQGVLISEERGVYITE